MNSRSVGGTLFERSTNCRMGLVVFLAVFEGSIVGNIFWFLQSAIGCILFFS